MRRLMKQTIIKAYLALPETQKENITRTTRDLLQGFIPLRRAVEKIGTYTI